MSFYTEESWEREDRQDRAAAGWGYEIYDSEAGEWVPMVPRVIERTVTVDTDGTCERCDGCGTFTGNQWGLCTRCTETQVDYDDEGRRHP